MPRKARDVRQRLTAKFAFVPATGKASDHEFLQLVVPGVPKVVTKLSHGKADIRDDILGFMAKQLKVSGPQFAEMMDCTMSKDTYVAHLVAWAQANGMYKPPPAPPG